MSSGVEFDERLMLTAFVSVMLSHCPVSVVSVLRLLIIESVSPMMNDWSDGIVREGIERVVDLTPSILSGQINGSSHEFVTSIRSSVPSTNTSVILRFCAKILC